MKECFKCNKRKALSEFYRHNQMADGHLNKCKDCTKSDVLLHRQENLEAIREYDRKRSKLPHRLDHTVNNTKKWREKYPKKYKAHSTLNNALRDGNLIRLPCEVCSDEKTVAHHCDYNKPLEVIWLCSPCHFQWHKEHGEGKY